jgi:uncharacterized lipoprotein YmbA
MTRSTPWNGTVVRAWWCGLFSLWVLGGCGSSPRVEYFALAPTERHGTEVVAISTPIQVAQVHLPPSLDREQMVRHTGVNTLDISDQHRWSAPLDLMIRQVLSQDLMKLLPPGKLILPQEPAPASTRKIVVNVVEFGADAQGTVRFEGTWSLIPPEPGAPPQNRAVRLSEPAGDDTASQVKSMSHILERLAAQIAAGAQP